MSDKMFPLPIEKLFKFIFRELEQDQSIFGIPRTSFFQPKENIKLQITRYGQILENPLGVAAGPHTQMAQGIISSWLAGARYIELKTVQTLDRLNVSKPCIDMEDEGYNCEWSQELLLNQSYVEYLHAWIMIHILREELNLKTDQDHLGTIFNMSVGYDLKGILQDNVQQFLAKMKNCSAHKKTALNKLRSLYPKIDQIYIPDIISDNVTLSTMHGCPPDEIERIGVYLLENQKLHTTVKLNPTLNGPDELREILNNKLGFKGINVPNIAFEHDLKYSQAKQIIKNLKELAQKLDLSFSIKLSNTLETKNNKGIFDQSNEMMYMSGRPLHVLAVNLAKKLQQDFDGNLDITFSAGVDAFNVTDVIKCNIKPITVCTDLLKPGGVERLVQYVSNLQKEIGKRKVQNVEDLTTKEANEIDLSKAIIKNLQQYLDRVIKDSRYQKKSFPWDNIKTNVKLSSFDCIQAPCVSTCPTNQQVPTYMYLLGKDEYVQALDVIRQENPFPNSTGMACDHICQEKCTRMNYDSPLLIRDIKRYFALKERKISSLVPKRKINKSVAVIGGGPSGLSAAYYLALEGFKVEIFEEKCTLGGMLVHALPNFRTIPERVTYDVERIKSLGIIIHEHSPIRTNKQMEKIKGKFDYLYVALGAQKSKKLNISGEDCQGSVDFLSFLNQVKSGTVKTLPRKVAVIGGGNSAIDTVRTAKRLMPKNAELYLLYRRTINEMPANREEIEDLLEENIKLMDLTAPNKVIVEGGKIKALECVKMKLAGTDRSGRPRPNKIPGSEFLIKLDYLITAIGQEIDFNGKTDDFVLNPQGTFSSKTTNIFVGGDMSRGPSSIINAIADGKNAAYKIVEKENLIIDKPLLPKKDLSYLELRKKRTIRKYGDPLPKSNKNCRGDFEVVVKTLDDKQAQAEAERCLMCDELCDICVTVCPNRANFSYQVVPVEYQLRDLIIKKAKASYSGSYTFRVDQTYQVMNIGDFCNECGNCYTFCPSSGAPYLEKPKIYLSRKTFYTEDNNAYFYEKDQHVDVIFAKINFNKYKMTDIPNRPYLYLESDCAKLKVDKKTLSPVKIDEIKKDGFVSFAHIAGLNIIFKYLKSISI